MFLDVKVLLILPSTDKLSPVWLKVSRPICLLEKLDNNYENSSKIKT